MWKCELGWFLIGRSQIYTYVVAVQFSYVRNVCFCCGSIGKSISWLMEYIPMACVVVSVVSCSIPTYLQRVFYIRTAYRHTIKLALQCKINIQCN